MQCWKGRISITQRRQARKRNAKAAIREAQDFLCRAKPRNAEFARKVAGAKCFSYFRYHNHYLNVLLFFCIFFASFFSASLRLRAMQLIFVFKRTPSAICETPCKFLPLTFPLRALRLCVMQLNIHQRTKVTTIATSPSARCNPFCIPLRALRLGVMLIRPF